MSKQNRDLLPGEKFDKLTVLSKLPNSGLKTYECRCKCGTIKKVTGSNLLRGKVKTCGATSCRNKAITHGLTDTPLHKVWQRMRYRVKHPTGNNECYKGISICKEWDDFKVFHDWAIANGYSQGKSIDRIEGNKDYSPSNCRWTDSVVQSQNRKGWKNAEVPFKGVFRSKPRNGKPIYRNTGKAPYYWIFFYKGEKFQKWGFTTAEAAYEDKCKFIKDNYDGLVIP